MDDAPLKTVDANLEIGTYNIEPVKGGDDGDSPFHWALRTKWTITLTTCMVCFLVGLNATGIASAPTAINERFNISDENFPNSFWPITSWTVGAATVPMIVLPLMEKYGTRPGYLICYGIFFFFVIPQAVAPNFATLIVCRFIAGSAAGVLQNCMDGIIADIWGGAVQRSLPVTIYVTCLLAGVSLGPVYGAAVTYSLYWRWILYIQLIMYGAVFIAIVLIVRETRGLVIQAKRGKGKGGQERTESQSTQDDSDPPMSPMRFLFDTLVLPARLLCTQPVVFFFTLLSGLSYGIVFTSTQSVIQVFSNSFGFEEYQAGLVQVSLVIGELLGFIACLFQNAWYAHVRRANPQKRETDISEARLYFSIPAAFIGLAGGLFWYGWTSYSSLPWILPATGLAMTSFGVTVVMQGITMYVTDAYAKYAASATAALCFGENMFAAFLPLAAPSMYSTLGFQWASSLLGFVALALSFAPIVLVWKGPRIRAHSSFMLEASYE